MIRYALACHVPTFARAIGVPLTLGEVERAVGAAAVVGGAGTRAGGAAMVGGGAEAGGAAAVVGEAASRRAAVAITFDDGPHSEGTPAVLELLAEFGATATFFLVGEQVRKRPELVARIVAGGHAVGLHGDRHRVQLRLSARAVANDLDRGRACIEDAAGVEVGVHRPPLGIYSPAGLEHVREIGLQPMLWSRWGRDWRRFTTPERIYERVTTKLIGGDVILLHDSDAYSGRGSYRHTVIATRSLLETLGTDGLATVRIAYDCSST